MKYTKSLLAVLLLTVSSQSIAGPNRIIFTEEQRDNKKKEAPFTSADDVYDFSSVLNLANLTSAQGFLMEGAQKLDYTGWSVSGAGDFNGDGIADMLIGAGMASPQNRTNAGEVYVIYGKPGGYTSPFNLYKLNGNEGFLIYGAFAGDNTGHSVSGAGDFNDDGLTDIIIGAPQPSFTGGNGPGMAYIIYGKKGGYDSFIDLLNLIPGQGFMLKGAQAGDFTGGSVSGIGDFNVDGIADVIIGAPGRTALGRRHAGQAYIIYGRRGGYNTTLDLQDLSKDQGFSIVGAQAVQDAGEEVSGAGDFNDDGIADVLVANPSADPQGRRMAGEVYVIYGKKGGYDDPLDLQKLTASQGFLIEGAQVSDWTGSSVSNIGDFNGDNITDIGIGAYNASPNGRNMAGAGYAIYGKKGGYSTSLDLSNITSSQGLVIEGIPFFQIGVSLSGAGDINSDGLDDLIIGASQASFTQQSYIGEAFVIYGKQGGYSSAIDLTNFSMSQGFTIKGAAANDHTGISVSEAGDVNSDGITDMIIGAYMASPSQEYLAGEAYIIYGNASSNNNRAFHSDPLLQSENKADVSPSKQFVLKEEIIDAGHKSEPFWASAIPQIQQWWGSLKGWWNKETQEELILSPIAQQLVELKEACRTLQAEAPEEVHSYYHYRLQDLMDSMEKMLQQPEAVTSVVIKKYQKKLARLQNDFIGVGFNSTACFSHLNNLEAFPSFKTFNVSVDGLSLPALQAPRLGY